MANVEKMIAETFLEMAQGLESGSYGKRPKIALTGMGSEHGEENAMEAALMAAKDGVDVYYIGSLEAEGVTTVKVADDEEGHKKMEEMLANGEVDGAVTMHFPFPIGVSTVGRVVTPAKGKEMFVANTTGTSSADRIEGMIKNTIPGPYPYPVASKLPPVAADESIFTMMFPVRESVTMISGVPCSTSFPLMTHPPSALADSANVISW